MFRKLFLHLNGCCPPFGLFNVQSAVADCSMKLGEEYSTQTIWERNELKIKGKTVLISPQKLFDDIDQNSSPSHIGRGGIGFLHCSNSWEQTHCMQMKKRLKTKELNTWKQQQFLIQKLAPSFHFDPGMTQKSSKSDWVGLLLWRIFTVNETSCKVNAVCYATILQKNSLG